MFSTLFSPPYHWSMTRCHTQWRRKRLATLGTCLVPVPQPSREVLSTWSSFLWQKQPRVHRHPNVQLLLLQGSQHLCPLCGWTPGCYPCLTASWTCSSILVSTSSWLLGVRPGTSWGVCAFRHSHIFLLLNFWFVYFHPAFTTPAKLTVRLIPVLHFQLPWVVRRLRATPHIYTWPPGGCQPCRPPPRSATTRSAATR